MPSSPTSRMGHHASELASFLHRDDRDDVAPIQPLPLTKTWFDAVDANRFHQTFCQPSELTPHSCPFSGNPQARSTLLGGRRSPPTCGNAGPHSGDCEIHGKDGVAGSIPAGGSTKPMTNANAGHPRATFCGRFSGQLRVRFFRLRLLSKRTLTCITSRVHFARGLRLTRGAVHFGKGSAVSQRRAALTSAATPVDSVGSMTGA
jgi:hypothetical protein